jgi:hypothetical protein
MGIRGGYLHNVDHTWRAAFRASCRIKVETNSVPAWDRLGGERVPLGGAKTGVHEKFSLVLWSSDQQFLHRVNQVSMGFVAT